MPKRSITDEEIALIKAMLDSGMKNKDVQFYFNRPDRPVNSGRISTIKNGSYGNSDEIAPAPKEALASFLSHAAKNPDPAKESVKKHIDRAFFSQGPSGDWILLGGESEDRECKAIFDPKKLTPVVKAVAGLANNKGGRIFFGISDGAFRVEGVGPEFAATDIVKIVEKVKAHLSPTPTITTKEIIEVGGRTVGYIEVAPHDDKPVIVYRDGDGLNEGEILFRYPGQTARIKFGDLRSLLEKRDRAARSEFANAIERLADVGPKNMMMLDVQNGVMDGAAKPILIDEKLLESIRFIKEGEFDEKAGSPTLKLVGNVTPVASAPTQPIEKISPKAIFQDDILDEFLAQNRVYEPFQYIEAALAQPRQWSPVFYFARMSGQTNAEIAERLKANRRSNSGKRKVLIDRLAGRKTAYTKAATKAIRRVATEITAGKLMEVKSMSDAVLFTQGILAVKSTTRSLPDLLASLQIARQVLAGDANALSYVFKAACRIDELFYSGDDPQSRNQS